MYKAASTILDQISLVYEESTIMYMYACATQGNIHVQYMLLHLSYSSLLL